jgi:hypothetical protein
MVADQGIETAEEVAKVAADLGTTSTAVALA